MLLEDYDQVIIPATVLIELSFRKAKKDSPYERRTAKVAWQVMANIEYYMTEYPQRISRHNNEGYIVPDSIPDIRNMRNDGNSRT